MENFVGTLHRYASIETKESSTRGKSNSSAHDTANDDYDIIYGEKTNTITLLVTSCGIKFDDDDNSSSNSTISNAVIDDDRSWK